MIYPKLIKGKINIAYIFLFIIGVLFSNNILAQPAGNCSTADLTINSTSSTTGNNTDNTGCADLIVDFTALGANCATGSVSFEVGQGNGCASGNVQVWITSDCGNPPDQTAGNTITLNSGGMASASITVCRPGQGPVCFQNIQVGGNCCNIDANCARDQDASCFGGADGQVSASTVGGTPPITYQWSANTGSATTQVVAGLPAGLYTVTATDANGCTNACAAQVNQPAAPVDAQCARDNDASCFGGNDGQVSVTTVGGTPPYTYQWAANAGSATTQVVTGLPAGLYTVTATDANGCTEACAAQVNQPAPSIACPNAGTFECDDAAGIQSWLGSYITNVCAGGTFENDYNPSDFPKCATTTKAINFSIKNAAGQTIASCVSNLTINAAPMPAITMPNLPAILSCADAESFTAPNANYSNGIMGACGISGSIFPSVTDAWSACGGKIIVTYMITTDVTDCGYLLQAGPFEIPVLPAPKPTVNAPAIPTSLTCIQADNFSIGSAAYSNGVIGGCNISGTIAPTIDNTGWTKCGGILKVTYLTTDQCNNILTAGPFSIPVLPAPEATASPPPPFPASITCFLATGFVAPPVTYDNGINGTCNITGTIQPSIANNFDKCGGNITVTYSTTDMCGRTISLPDFVIPVDPAPEAMVTVPPVPLTLSCEMATTFMAQNATYANGLAGTPCDISGSFAPTVNSDFDKCGGTIKLTYLSQDMCNRVLNGGTFTIIVDPAPAATVTMPVLPTSISCEMAVNYMPPSANYSNGLMGTCEISGMLTPTVTPDFDKCGGKITVIWTGQDMCGRPLVTGPKVIDVDPAPTATVSVPWIPSPISCVMADGFMAPDATYSNGLMGACEISGTIPATVTPNFDKCGGTITLNWSGTDMCGRALTAGPIVIQVAPAPEATIMQPNIPTTLSCADADVYMAPDAPYSNGLTGTCEISGTVSGVVTPNFDACGGNITITYNGVDECGRTIIAASFSINVDPAPMATVTVPFVPNSLSCEDATTYAAPTASYNNGLTGVCNISGTINPMMTPNYDACGGTIVITYNSQDDCGRPLSATRTINVQPAPTATVTVPNFPTSITCEESQTFLEEYASYTNGLMGVCNISGFIQPVVNKVVDACNGGYITLAYSGMDQCGRPLSAPTVYITVEPAPPAVLTIPETPMMLQCWEAENYSPGNATYTNGLTGVCENSGTIYPTLMELWDDRCEGGFIIISYDGYDDCGNHLSYPAYKIPILPDAIAPIGECKEIEESFQFIYQTPTPDELGDYKYQIASNYWDYCSAIVVTVVSDTGEPVCGLDGKFERVYGMEVADECGNVADTCMVRFYGNCNPEYCTLSQSFYAGQWGEDWGQDSLFGFSSIEIIDSLLAYGEDSIKIGTGTCGFYLDDPYCVQQILKGEGTSYFLWNDYNLNCGAPLNNTLINQTIVTILNVRYNELFNGLDFGNYQLSATCKNYPQYMLDDMPDHPTVNDLITYANNFIGCPCSGTCGDFENTPIAWDITCSLLALNSRFHECNVPGPCHLDNKNIHDYATPQMLEDQAASNFTENTYNLNIGAVTLPDMIDFFPNPADQVLNVRLTTNNANTYRIRVLSANGAEVLSQEVDMVKGDNTTQLNIEQLDRGMYLLFIEGNDTQWSERFVKMKK